MGVRGRCRGGGEGKGEGKIDQLFLFFGEIEFEGELHSP